MRPHERHGRTGGVADEELALGNVGAVPDLLREKTALAGDRFHSPGKFLSDVRSAGRKFVVCAFARQQRPCATDPRAVKGFTVCMFAVRVALIAMPGRTPRRIHLERGINDFHGTDDARIIRRP